MDIADTATVEALSAERTAKNIEKRLSAEGTKAAEDAEQWYCKNWEIIRSGMETVSIL